MYTELSLQAQTAYAQLLESVQAGDYLRSIASLPGSFSPKVVKGRTYWYFQYFEPSGKLRQVYVGPDTEPVRKLVEQKRAPTPQQEISRQVRATVALGCEPVLPRHYRVIERLAEYGFFRAGGVLIGTHAFIAYGNLLGVHWGMTERTQDVDFAHAGRSLAIALPSTLELNTDDAIASLQMGFLPISGLTDKSGATYLNPKEPAFRLDFLTPLCREPEPYVHPALGIKLQPLKFMEYSLENVQQAVIFSGDRAVLVNVPAPARYALHKLLLYGERSGEFATKTAKDLMQAVSLLLLLREHAPWEVEAAWQDLLARGGGWRRRVMQGLAQIERRYADTGLAEWIRAFPETAEADDTDED